MAKQSSLEQWTQMAATSRYDAKMLARLCNLSVRQLERDFRRELDRPPQDWLNGRRIEAAKSSLLAGEPVKKVAFDLGYKQASHFCRQFKKSSTLTPSQFVRSSIRT
jgi:AraC family transcriptional regulator